MEPCKHCDHFAWCEKRGCTAWNDRSREDFSRLKARSKEINDEIDRLQELLGVDDARWHT